MSEALAPFTRVLPLMGVLACATSSELDTPVKSPCGQELDVLETVLARSSELSLAQETVIQEQKALIGLLRETNVLLETSGRLRESQVELVQGNVDLLEREAKLLNGAYATCNDDRMALLVEVREFEEALLECQTDLMVTLADRAIWNVMHTPCTREQQRTIDWVITQMDQAHVLRKGQKIGCEDSQDKKACKEEVAQALRWQFEALHSAQFFCPRHSIPDGAGGEIPSFSLGSNPCENVPQLVLSPSLFKDPNNLDPLGVTLMQEASQWYLDCQNPHRVPVLPPTPKEQNPFELEPPQQDFSPAPGSSLAVVDY